MSLVASTVGVVGAGSRTRVEAGLGEDVKPEVAAVLDPLVVGPEHRRNPPHLTGHGGEGVAVGGAPDGSWLAPAA
jgi:hypothetical protein